MKEPVQVTLIQLRDYLLAQRPDKPINMGSGYNEGVGCLMTQYGRDHGFLFDYSSNSNMSWTDGKTVVATMDGGPFEIFYRPSDHEYKDAYQIATRYPNNTCGYWMDLVKDKTNK